MIRKVLFIMLVVCCIAPQVKANVTVYVNNPNGNYLYAWDDQENRMLGDLPGTDISSCPTVTYKDVTYRKVTITTDKDVISVIPNNGNGSQTGDITGVKDGNYITVDNDWNYSNQGVALSSENFPDANFLKYIVDQKFDKDNNGFLSQEEINNKKSIDCRYKAISSIKGIEYFTELTSFTCVGNPITSIDVSKNTKLTQLNCMQCQFSDIDVSKNTLLTNLSCGGNKLTSLDISKNVNLTTLACHSNQLDELDVTHNTALTSLTCTSNKLTELDLSKNLALTSLSCDYNSLPALDISLNTQLTYLQCSYNKLPSLDVSHNLALTTIYCYNNLLPKLDVSLNTALVNLSCYTNKIPVLDVTNNPVLEFLDCAANLLPTLDVTKNPVLKQLICNSNKLPSLDVSKNPLLEKLICSYNPLSGLDVTHNPELRYLACTNNQLPALDVTQNPKLYFLDCFVNEIPELDLTHNPLLTNVRCYHNKIPYLDVTQCPVLKELHCGSNLIPSIDLSKNPVLNSFVCEQNPMPLVDVTHNPVLTSLGCAGCNIKHLDISQNTKLTSLSCNSNSLTELDLSHNPELTHLVCQYNRIENLDLSNNLKINYLQCYANAFVCFDASFLTDLTTTFLGENQTRKMPVTYRNVNGEPKYVVPMPSYFVNDETQNLYITSIQTEGVSYAVIDGVKCFVSDKFISSIRYYYNINKKLKNKTTGELEEKTIDITLKMTEPHAVFTMDGDYYSRYRADREVNSYKNVLTLNLNHDSNYEIYDGTSYTVMRDDNKKIARVDLTLNRPKNDEPYYSYKVTYAPDAMAQNNSLRYDNLMHVTEGPATDGIELSDYFTASTADGGDKAGSYRYTINEDLLTEAYSVPVYAATVDVNPKNRYTRQDVDARDNDHSLGVASESLITVTPQNGSNTDQVVVYNNDQEASTNDFDTQYGVDGDANGENVYSCALKQGDNTWGTNKSFTEVPTLELMVGDQLGDQLVSEETSTNENGETICGYAARVYMEPTTTTAIPVVYYYRVWRVDNGKEVLINTTYGRPNSDYSGIRTTYPEDASVEPVNFYDVFVSNKFIGTGSKTVTYIVRMYCAEAYEPASSMLMADNSDNGYYVVEQQVDVTFNNSIPTGIEGVVAGKNVQSVRYYNANGQYSDKAFDGLNFVVTTYTDGTTATSKLMK